MFTAAHQQLRSVCICKTEFQSIKRAVLAYIATIAVSVAGIHGSAVHDDGSFRTQRYASGDHLPQAFSAFGVFMMRQFYQGIPG